MDRLKEPGTINGVLTIIGAALAIYGFSPASVTEFIGYLGTVITAATGIYNMWRRRDELRV